MRILVVEDDSTIASFVVKGLQGAGFAVDHAENGVEALHLASSEDYAVAVVDIMLPGMDGLALIEEMRQRRIKTPVIILSARRTVDDRVKGLQAGGDDYLTKPFAFAELLARVQALIRRASGASDPTRLVVGDLVMDLVSRRVKRAGRVLELRPREFALLEYLMRNAGRVVDLAAWREGDDALLVVRDTGPGISAEDLPRIFDRLYRGDRSRSERGLGLGLSLVKAIVEAHQGRVSVESSPGQGSTFTVRLPACD